jgi:hypothetical protein
MRKIFKIILLPFKLVLVLVLEWMLRRYDDYNQAFKNGWHY